MKDILTALQMSIDFKNWYAALFITLTIPDICSKLENPSTPTNQRYTSWFDKYKDEVYNDHITGRDCYALRCSYMHEGSFITEGQSIKPFVDKFSFSPEGTHLFSMEDIYTGSEDDGKAICHLAVKNFADDMLRFANKWLSDISADTEIQKRINEMIIIKNGAEFFGGMIKINP